MTTYRLILVLKFLGVTLFVGGYIAGALGADPHARRRAVHQIAAPGLLLTWITGFTLVALAGLPWTELWLMAGLALSLMAKMCLIAGLKDRRAPLIVGAVALLCALTVMVFRPTWGQLL